MEEKATAGFAPLGYCLRALLDQLGTSIVSTFEDEGATAAFTSLLAREGFSAEPLGNPFDAATDDAPRLVFCAPPNQHSLTSHEEERLATACDALGIAMPKLTVWAYASLALYHAGTKGKAVVVMPMSALSRAAWRMGQQAFVDSKLIEAVAALPRPITVTSQATPAIGRKHDDVLPYDAIVVLSRNCQHVAFANAQASYTSNQNPFEHVTKTSYDTIVANGYLLNPARYQATHEDASDGVRLGAVATIARGVSMSKLKSLSTLARTSLRSIEPTRDGLAPVAYLTSKGFAHGVDYATVGTSGAHAAATYYAASDLNAARITISQAPSILLSRTGEPFKTCLVDLSSFDLPVHGYIVADNVYRILPTPELDPVYLLAYLTSKWCQSQLSQLSRSSLSTKQISPNDLRNLLLPLPPLKEQRAIASSYVRLQSQLMTLDQQRTEIISKRSSLFDEIG